MIAASKSFEDDSLPIHHKWYKFNYSCEKISDARLNELRSPQIEDNGKALDLPPVNNLIAANFDILPEDETFSKCPKLIQQWGDNVDLWYQKDDKFKKPKAIISLKIYTTDLGFGTSPEAQVFSEVWKNLVLERLREFTYLADCAKLKF